MVSTSAPRPVIAPELDASLAWLNTPPLRLAALRGHPLLLVFWNAGSSHCLNLLQSLVPLHSRFREGLRIVAVHVPKFDYERDGAVALPALRQQGLAVPLANDGDWVAWQHYEVGAWPTAILLDAEGVIRGRFVGDREIEALQEAVEAQVDANFLRSPGVVEALRLDMPEGRSALNAPAGLVASPSRLYVADTGNHRILECTHEGRLLRRIGTGNRDFVDGLADVAGFHSPTSMVLLQDRLYVADSGNHAIRRINVRTGEVDTLVGNGRCGDPTPGPVRQPQDSALDRPQGLALAENALLIGMASGHQLWAFELGRNELRLVSGQGSLGEEEGAASEARFAQPVAVLAHGDSAYVLDATSSALRQVRLADGAVRNLFGRGLFEFGHKDGGSRTALMQHPTALAPAAGGLGLWIADTGNAALRRFLFRTQALSTMTLPADLHRPAALAAWENQLWIADAGNHLVWRLDVESGEMHRLPVGE
jgi:thiol-disulfide isomerase/thioredoxin